ncbi:hypothetical protein C8A05DRAFT_35023 [Staphylotrichum tortipilum]|uniref:Uncharacterized protein n=1 Tax=Staphylotrichum tortipilum TaxID=2831512 RepID=A0AAN6MJH1_9PEZI|nr:hypothetical protein C8A05DRAFT_35023 [Staphylotrichum longicolle]
MKQEQVEEREKREKLELDLGLLRQELQAHNLEQVRQHLHTLQQQVDHSSTNTACLLGQDLEHDSETYLRHHPLSFPYALNTSYIPRNASVDFTALAPGTYIVGRGAVHAKAAIAAQIVAVRELATAGVVSPESVGLLFASGGHNLYRGMQRFSAGGAEGVRAVIFGEPTGGRLACGARGWIKGSIYVLGKAWGDGKGVEAVLRRVVGRVVGTVFGRGGRFGETRVTVGEVRTDQGWGRLMPESAVVDVKMEVAAGDQGSGAEMVAEEIRRMVVNGERAKGLDGSRQ